MTHTALFGEGYFFSYDITGNAYKEIKQYLIIYLFSI